MLLLVRIGGRDDCADSDRSPDPSRVICHLQTQWRVAKPRLDTQILGQSLSSPDVVGGNGVRRVKTGPDTEDRVLSSGMPLR